MSKVPEEHYPTRVIPSDLPQVRLFTPRHDVQAPIYKQWRNWTDKRSVHSIAKHPDGSLWLATDGGIIRWDLTTLSPVYSCFHSEHGLAGNVAEHLVVDGTGTIWARHPSGLLSYFIDGEWHLFPFLSGVQHMVACLEQGIWVATAQGVYKVIDKTANPLPLSTSCFGVVNALATLPDNDNNLVIATPASLYFYSEERMGEFPWHVAGEIVRQGIRHLLWYEESLWIGTNTGLFRVSFKDKTTPPSSLGPQSTVRALVPAPDGLLVLFEHTEYPASSLYHFDTQLGKLSPIFEQVALSNIRTMVSGTESGIWYGTPSGFYHLSASHHEVYHVEPFANHHADDSGNTLSNNITALTLAPFALWGTTDTGLFYLPWQEWKRGKKYYYYSYYQQLAGSIEMRHDPRSGWVWLATTQQGTYRFKFDDTPNQVAYPLQVVPDNHYLGAASIPTLATAVEIGNDDSVWVAVGARGDTENADGLWHYYQSEWDLYWRTLSLIRAIASARDGTVWVATNEGVFHISLPLVTEPSPIGQNLHRNAFALCVFELLGTEILSFATDAGIFIYDGDTITSIYTPPMESTSIEAAWIFRPTTMTWSETTQTLWVGTTSGLLRLRWQNKQWQPGERITPWTSGLGGAVITSLVAFDDTTQPTLWIGTRTGLSCFEDYG